MLLAAVTYCSLHSEVASSQGTVTSSNKAGDTLKETHRYDLKQSVDKMRKQNCVRTLAAKLEGTPAKKLNIPVNVCRSMGSEKVMK